MAVFKYDDAVKYKFKYLYEVINNIESNKKISVEVKKNQYLEQLLEPTKNNAKLKTLKEHLKKSPGPKVIQFLKDNNEVFKTPKEIFLRGLKSIKLLILKVVVHVAGQK